MHSASTATLAVDGHLHWYPAFVPARAWPALIAHLAGLLPATPGRRLALLAEGGGHRYFVRWRDGQRDGLPASWMATVGQDGLSLNLSQDGETRVCLIAGRQMVARERIEVLGVALAEALPDGLPARELVARIRAAGGVPVLPWAPGKWFFERGRLVRDLIETAAPGALVVADSAMRPAGWPLPILIRRARARGLAVIAGSDPLPLPGEETQMGRYGFTYAGDFNWDAPAASVRRMLAGDPALLRVAGRRNGIPEMLARLWRLRAAKK